MQTSDERSRGGQGRLTVVEPLIQEARWMSQSGRRRLGEIWRCGGMGISKLRRSRSRVLHLRLVPDQKELEDRAWPLGRNVAREEGCSKARRR